MSLPRRFGFEHPIIQAPMAGVQGSALASAVSQSGGLGSLPAAMLTPDTLAGELSAMRAQSLAPVNVNFFCHPAPILDEVLERRWRELLIPYYREFGLEPDLDASPRAARTPFDASFIPVLEAYRPEVVSFHFGLPPSDLLQQVQRLGAAVVSTATTVAEARWLEAHGVDAVIAQGSEAGGHRGMFLTTDAHTQTPLDGLLPRIVRAVHVPVIAAGGIASGADVRHVLALGAACAQAGSAYLLCPEATTSAVHRAALRAPERLHTALTNLHTGRLARGIVNRIMRELGPIRSDVPEFPLAAAALAPLRARAESQGSSEFSPMWAGTNASTCLEVSAAEVTLALAAR